MRVECGVYSLCEALCNICDMSSFCGHAALNTNADYIYRMWLALLLLVSIIRSNRPVDHQHRGDGDGGGVTAMTSSTAYSSP